MIINKITKQIQTRSDKPNENWLDEEWIALDNDSEFAKIIQENYPYINITIENDTVINVVVDEEKRNKEKRRTEIQTEIETLKQKLSDTDYQAIKYAEGQITEEDYRPIREQRQAWRDKINELESGLEVQDENN